MSEISAQESKDISKGINPLQRIKYASLSGRSARKLARQNTVHLRALCPDCGNVMVWKKITAAGAKNVWMCRGCKKVLARKDLPYVKYV